MIADFVNEAHDTHHPICVGLYHEDQKREASARSGQVIAARMPKLREAWRASAGMCLALSAVRARPFQPACAQWQTMNKVIYIIGLIVVVIAVASWLGLR